MIPFTQLPANFRVPLFYAEIDPSKANSGAVPQRSLIVGQVYSTSGMTLGVPALLQGLSWIQAQAGPGSQLALMCAAYRKRDPYGEVWVLPIGEPVGGVQATGTLTLGGTPTAAGALFLYIGGELVVVPVTVGQATTALAAAVVAAVNAVPTLPTSASASGSVVTFTAKNRGLNGNDIDLRLNYLGNTAGEALPAGLTATFAAMSGGLVNPTGATLDSALSNVGERSFDFIAWAWNDATTLNSLGTWLAGQWDPLHLFFGQAFAAFKGTLSAAVTLGTSRNDPRVSIMPAYDSPTPPMVWAANVCGAAAVSLRNDPGLPLQTLPLDVKPPPNASRFKRAERNTLLWNSMSTFTVDDDGTVRLETVITTYSTNPAGVPDDFRPGNPIVTPSIIRNALIGRYRRQERDGLVQNSDLFAQQILVQRSGANVCRVDGLLPVVPIDQLRVLALLIQFRKSNEVI
jgi:phage tail sheath gpL-like